MFNGESVLQETIIIKIRKTKNTPNSINITTSSTSDFSDIEHFKTSYDTVVAKNQFVYLVTNKEDANVLQMINNFHRTLPEIGLKMQTGIIVDFRTREVLRDRLEEGAYPLLYSQHIRDGKVVWPLGKEGEVIKTERNGFCKKTATTYW